MSDWNDSIMSAFHENGGTVEPFGRGIVIMHTIGAKSGSARPSPVFGLPDGDGAWLVAATAAGHELDPAWAHNLRAHPDIDLEVALPESGVETVQVHTTELPEPARTEGWERFKQHLSFAEYETKTDRVFPIFRFTTR